MSREFQNYAKVKLFHQEIKDELVTMTAYIPVEKDILVIVHNQLEYLKACLASIKFDTQNYNIYVWDNDSDEITREWLQDQANQKNIKVLVRSEENLGFIIPNNELAKMTKSPYIILLNSDTVVLPDWDKAIISHLNAGCDQVGYSGGRLGNEGTGIQAGYGLDLDYLEGWCFGLTRETFQRFGLFDDKNLSFAYGEDADLSLRLKEAGLTVYALHLNLVFHHGHKTIAQVSKVRNCRKSYEDNHLYIKKRWESVLLKRMELCSK